MHRRVGSLRQRQQRPSPLAAAPDVGRKTTGGGEGRAARSRLLLPETKTARYETQDRPLFEAKLKELCPDCELIYSNANQDAAKQQQQAEAALTNGAKVHGAGPGGLGTPPPRSSPRPRSKDVPVVSLRPPDHLDAPIDYYISFDNEKVGELQGQALVDKLTADGKADGTDRDDQRRADRQQRQAVQGRRAQVFDASG